jgi:hypothetical protein
MRSFVLCFSSIMLIHFIITSCYYRDYPNLSGDILLNITHPDSVVTKITNFKVPDDSVITINPSFPMGLDSLSKILKHPDLARKAGVYGEVILNLDIDIDGSTKNIKPVKKITVISDSIMVKLKPLEFTPAFTDKIRVKSSV